MDSKPLACIVKSALHVKIGDHKVEFNSGCSVIDVTFPNMFYVELREYGLNLLREKKNESPNDTAVVHTKPRTQPYPNVHFSWSLAGVAASRVSIQSHMVGEIHFKNFYASNVTLKAKKKPAPGEGDGKWKTCLSKLPLMPHCHCDQGAEDYVTITSKQLTWPLQNIVGLRFIIRQASPIWKDFKIEDIRVYKNSISSPREVSLPNWITEPAKEEADRQLKGIASIPVVSKDLQQMWALTEQVKAQQPYNTLGRYDIDGSYEINLLSYT